MIRVYIKEISAETHFAYKDFISTEEADAYIAEMKASEHWGKSEKDNQDAEIEFIKEDIASQLEQQKKNQESLAYLAATDWLIIRETETGVNCPIEVKVARAAARAAIVK